MTDWEAIMAKKDRSNVGQINRSTEKAHRLSALHRSELSDSSICGCFYCCTKFNFTEITQWIDDEQTALCPNCGVDAVIGSTSNLDIRTEFLKQVNALWFGEESPLDHTELFQELERDRASGKLKEDIWGHKKFLYGSSKDYAGMIDRLARDGTVTVGVYSDGQFIPKKQASVKGMRKDTPADSEFSDKGSRDSNLDDPDKHSGK